MISSRAPTGAASSTASALTIPNCDRTRPRHDKCAARVLRYFLLCTTPSPLYGLLRCAKNAQQCFDTLTFCAIKTLRARPTDPNDIGTTARRQPESQGISFQDHSPSA